MAEHSILPPSELAVWLRAQPALTGTAPPLRLADLPDDPVPLFRGWAFAGARSSRKAAQLEARPAAALNLWWQPQRRAVRVRGTVEEGSPAESDADLAARSEDARAGLQSGDWVLWRVVPTRVEFWQGSRDRNHTRIVYDRVDGRWQHTATGADPGSGAR